jgi:hypothetical protein
MRASTSPALLLAALLLLGGRGTVAPDALSAQTRTDLTGAWIFSVTTENGTGTPSVTLEQEGEEITGLYSSPRLGARRLVGTFDGDTLVFRIAPGEGSEIIMTFTGTLQEDGTLAGTADFGGMGGASFTAVRAGTRIGTGGALPDGVQKVQPPGSAVD